MRYTAQLILHHTQPHTPLGSSNPQILKSRGAQVRHTGQASKLHSILSNIPTRLQPPLKKGTKADSKKEQKGIITVLSTTIHTRIRILCPSQSVRGNNKKQVPNPPPGRAPLNKTRRPRPNRNHPSRHVKVRHSQSASSKSGTSSSRGIILARPNISSLSLSLQPQRASERALFVQEKQNKPKQKGTKYVNEGATATRCAKKGKEKENRNTTRKKTSISRCPSVPSSSPVCSLAC